MGLYVPKINDRVKFQHRSQTNKIVGQVVWMSADGKSTVVEALGNRYPVKTEHLSKA